MLNNWESGVILQIPKNINQPFYWRTSPIINGDSIYKDEFIPTSKLNNENDFTAFLNPPISLKNINNKNPVIITPNISGDTIMIIPTLDKNPNTNKYINYSSLYYFCKNASLDKQKKLWYYVALTIKHQLKIWKKIWVSVHGSGVGYLHIRLSKQPKYYGNSPLANL